MIEENERKLGIFAFLLSHNTFILIYIVWKECCCVRSNKNMSIFLDAIILKHPIFIYISAMPRNPFISLRGEKKSTSVFQNSFEKTQVLNWNVGWIFFYGWYRKENRMKRVGILQGFLRKLWKSTEGWGRQEGDELNDIFPFGQSKRNGKKTLNYNNDLKNKNYFISTRSS